MGSFVHNDFLLQSRAARTLYHEHAAPQPIIDYHNHLSPRDIAEDRRFTSLAEAWLEGDHYKWRAMRANGIDEKFVTGNATPWEKFHQYAATVPYALGNPLYHWTHLELKRYFEIDDLLGPETAKAAWNRANEMLQQPEFSVRGLLRRMNVRVICTTDDPVDSLEYHQQIAKDSSFDIAVYPTFRPDRALAIENGKKFNTYLDQFGEASNTYIALYSDLLDALEQRCEYFHTHGCRLADHALAGFVMPDESTVPSADDIFSRVRDGHDATPAEACVFRRGLLRDLAAIYAKRGWVQQFHLGALRNVNTRAFTTLGPDTGFDTIGDGPIVEGMANLLDSMRVLPKTILYNLNPRDNYAVAALTGAFQRGHEPGHVQYGAAWWFLDQKKGIETHLKTLANTGLLRRFVGMLTDSRSFLSFPRHEYFRRVLCDLLGQEMETGNLPNDIALIGAMVGEICHENAVHFFPFPAKRQV